MSYLKVNVISVVPDSTALNNKRYCIIIIIIIIIFIVYNCLLQLRGFVIFKTEFK